MRRAADFALSVEDQCAVEAALKRGELPAPRRSSALGGGAHEAADTADTADAAQEQEPAAAEPSTAAEPQTAPPSRGRPARKQKTAPFRGPKTVTHLLEVAEEASRRAIHPDPAAQVLLECQAVFPVFKTWMVECKIRENYLSRPQLEHEVDSRDLPPYHALEAVVATCRRKWALSSVKLARATAWAGTTKKFVRDVISETSCKPDFLLPILDYRPGDCPHNGPRVFQAVMFRTAPGGPLRIGLILEVYRGSMMASKKHGGRGKGQDKLLAVLDKGQGKGSADVVPVADGRSGGGTSMHMRVSKPSPRPLAVDACGRVRIAHLVQLAGPPCPDAVPCPDAGPDEADPADPHLCEFGATCVTETFTLDPVGNIVHEVPLTLTSEETWGTKVVIRWEALRHIGVVGPAVEEMRMEVPSDGPKPKKRARESANRVHGGFIS